MKTYRIRANSTTLPTGAFGGSNSHKKISDASDSTYVTITSNRKGSAAQKAPHWWFRQSMPKGKILRVRMGVRVMNRGVIGMAGIRWAARDGRGINSDVNAAPTTRQMPAFTSTPKSFFTPWMTRPPGLKRDWLPEDLEAFYVVPKCKKWKGKSNKKTLASTTSLGSARIISVSVYVEYATATKSAPTNVQPKNSSVQVNPRPYLQADVRKHPDGIKQRVQWDILAKDAQGKFTKVVATRYSHPHSGNFTAYGYYGSSGGYPSTPYSHPQGVYQVRARAVTEYLTNPGPWSKPQSFTVKHAPKALNLSPGANQTVGWTTSRLFKWRFQDPWTNDRMKSYRIQVLNANSNKVLVDTGDKTDFTTLKVIKPTKSNSRSYTAPANVDYQAIVTMPAAAKGVPLKWRLLVRDKEGVAGSWTSYVPFAMADNPTITIEQPYDEPDNGKPLFSLTVVEPDPITVAKTIEVTVKEKAKGLTVYQAVVNIGEKPKYVLGPIAVDAYASLIAKPKSPAETFSSPYKSDGVYKFQPKKNFMVNGSSYVITAKVTATNSLSGSKSKNVKAIFPHPTPVAYDIDWSRIDIDGAVHIDWSQATPDEDFHSWNLYRMRDGEGWELIYQTDNEFTREYADYMFVNDNDYMYTVTQTAETDGALLESPLGYRGVPMDDRTNLSENPGFEFDTSLWSTLFDTPLTRRKSNWRVLDNTPTSMPEEVATYTMAANTINMALHKVTLPVDNPSHIFGSVNAYTPQANRWGGLSVSFLDENDSIVAGGSDGAMTEMDTYGWNELTLPPIAVPADAYYALFGIAVYGAEDGITPVPGRTEVNIGAFLADAANPLELPNYEYFDGDTIGAMWSGTRGVSTSVMIDNAVPEEEMTHVRSGLFMLIDMDDVDDPKAVAMKVNDHGFKDNVEREVSNIMGRGRHVNMGTRLGYDGSFTAQLRGVEGEPTLAKNTLIDFYQNTDRLYLRSAYDMLIRVSIDSPDFKELAGTGENQMLDVTVNYEEVYSDADDDELNLPDAGE